MGKLSLPKSQEKYETGQLFLHRIFGYRGIILFPWRAKVYDRNSYVASNDETTTTTNDGNSDETNAINEATASTSENETTINDGQTTTPNGTNDSTVSRRIGNKEITVNVQNYYQVLIDSRDCPHVVSRNA